MPTLKTAPHWNSPNLGTLSSMPKLAPPVMGNGDWFSIGSWNAPPTGQALTDWNSWLQKIGMPQNTFGQFSINPTSGQYALRDQPLPLTAVQRYAQAMGQKITPMFGLGPMQKLNQTSLAPANVTNPLPSYYSAPKSTAQPSPAAPAPAPAPMPTPMQTPTPIQVSPLSPNRTNPNQSNPFPNYYGRSQRRVF